MYYDVSFLEEVYFLMNELERIISKYFSKDGTGITYSDFNIETISK